MKKVILTIILALAVISLGAHYSSLDDIINEHVHSAAQVYPTLAGGVAVLGGAGWTLGGFVQIVPADTIDADFDIHHVLVENLSANDVYEIVLYYGAGNTECGRVRVVQDAVFSGVLNIPFQTIIMPANSRVQAKSASSTGGDTATISLFYHTY